MKGPSQVDEIALSDMRVLVTTVPTVPTYFNAGHRIAIGLQASFLRRLGASVDVRDMAALTCTWREVAEVLTTGEYDVVSIVNDFDFLEGFGRFVTYTRHLSPKTRIVTSGRLSSVMPNFFKKYDIDGIIVSGDPEAGVAGFVHWTRGAARPPGVAMRDPGGLWCDPEAQGALLAPEDWALPDIADLPHQAYDQLYGSDRHRFSGIPGRRELVVPMARGCPMGCYFCEIWQREGLRERRLSVERTIEYIDRSTRSAPCEYVSFYAPTFTLNRSWVYELCGSLRERPVRTPWKCCTTVHHLDQDLIMHMGQAGCFRISVGQETLEGAGLGLLPRAKRSPDKLLQVIDWSQQAGIELNVFLVLGLPGTSTAGAASTIELLERSGVRVRPTLYSDYGRLDADMTESEVAEILSRHLLPSSADDDDTTRADAAAWYQLEFAEYRNTRVMEHIPRSDRVE
jgi:radical SAM superfamily enzyme YgiQ (UPF0313 family)